MGNSFFKLRAHLIGIVLLAWFANGSVCRAEEEEFQLRYFDLTEGRLAFAYAFGDKKDIYVADFKTLDIAPLVTTNGADEAPAWSPDGQKLVFQSDVSGDREIYIINADGTGMKRLTKSDGPDEYPSFSPDGEKIIFQSARRGQGSEIFVMDADGANQKALITNPPERPETKNVTPRYSPRGDEILYVTDLQWPGWDIILYSSASKEKKVFSQGTGSYVRPAWAPDGGSFAFAYGSGNEFDLYTIGKGASNPTRLFHSDGRELDPCWNDDGSPLFYAAEANAGQGDFQLMVWDKAQSRSSPIMNSKGQVRNPAWTPFPTMAEIAADLKKKQDAAAVSGDRPAR